MTDKAPLELTPEQKVAWDNTMSLMVWTCPGFRHLFYKLLTASGSKYFCVLTKDVPIAATDAKNILINPDTFFQLGLKERVFVIAHEVMHNVYGDVEFLHRCSKSKSVPMHDGTSLPFNNPTMQKAMDFRINALLKESKIGVMPSMGCWDEKIATGEDSVVDVYKKIYDGEEPDGGGQGPGGFDQLLPPGKSTGQQPDAAAAQRNQQQWAVEIASAQTLENMRTQGHMPGALKRMFQSILEPQVPWTEHIRSSVARRTGSGGWNWRIPDHLMIDRDLYAPSRSGFGAGWIVMWGDTSGSMGSGEIEKAMAEIAGIMDDVKPKRLTVLWGDAAIANIDEIEDAIDLETIKARGVGGGGGTDVLPALKWIEEQQEMPDMFIGFTDGGFTFPGAAPHYPVIWATVEKAVKYPWGEVVNIN